MDDTLTLLFVGMVEGFSGIHHTLPLIHSPVMQSNECPMRHAVHSRQTRQVSNIAIGSALPYGIEHSDQPRLSREDLFRCTG